MMQAAPDRLDISQALPHRGHALFAHAAWIDSEDNKVVRGGGSSSWAADHPVLQGHFPGLPIVPGVFLIEAAAQIAGVLLVGQGSTGNKIGMLAGVRKVLVHQPVTPDQKVIYEINVRPGGEGFYIVDGNGSVGGVKVITFEFMIGVADKAALNSKGVK